MKSHHVGPLFYAGVLVSSIGSSAFANALMAFLVLSHFPLAQASLIIGLQRILPTLGIAVFGQWTDRWSPRKTIVGAEIAAALVSVSLLVVWQGSATNILLLGGLCVVRASVVSFQIGSRAKISKSLSGSSFSGNSSHAMWLNKATQGAALFSGALAWVFVSYFSLEAAILFDLATFVVNGVIVFLLPKSLLPEVEKDAQPDQGEVWSSKFRDFVRLNPTAFLFDVVLFVSTGGLLSYCARLSGAEPQWMGLFLAAYGLSVWVAGFAERRWTNHLSTLPFWFGIGLSYLILGQFKSSSVWAVGVSFVTHFCFWIIFHRVSAKIQLNTPFEKMGSVASARSVFLVLLSSGAEILVGAWSTVVSHASESALRAALVFCFASYLFLSGRFREVAVGPA